MISSIILNIKSENINSCEKYFKGTKALKDNFSDKELKIKLNMREFKSIGKNKWYDEIFLNDDSEIFGGITNQIYNIKRIFDEEDKPQNSNIDTTIQNSKRWTIVNVTKALIYLNYKIKII